MKGKHFSLKKPFWDQKFIQLQICLWIQTLCVSHLQTNHFLDTYFKNFNRFYDAHIPIYYFHNSWGIFLLELLLFRWPLLCHTVLKKFRKNVIYLIILFQRFLKCDLIWEIGSIALLWWNAKCNVNPGLIYFERWALTCARLFANLHLHFAFRQSKATLPYL